MRRLALIGIALLAATAGALTTVAGADDTHTYKIELDNAFGLVEESPVKVAGVEAGVVTGLDINEDKRALVTVETQGAIGVLGEDSTCSSEPQSLIAEYFIDCQPEGDPLPEGGTIPVEQVTQTIQPDLVNNTLREPFKRRLQLLINEFGTALAGNPDNLNAAIRRGAPALRDLEQVLDILGDHNRIIRDLNANSDRIVGRLAERREDVVRFIEEARDTAKASAGRRADLSRNFEILDDFLAELRPTLADTEALARAQTPVLEDLRASAPGLNTLAQNLPAFNEASEASLTELGEASIVGRRALRNAADEIEEFRVAGKDAPAGASNLARLLVDLDDRKRAVDTDVRSPRGKGFTGYENLINYLYYQTGAINQYDEIGHLLHVGLYEPESPCTPYNTAIEGVPAADGGMTHDPAERHRCVSWGGPTQPGITVDDQLPPYDPSVCPQGSTMPEVCTPAGGPSRLAASGPGLARREGRVDGDGRGGSPTGQPDEATGPADSEPPPGLEGLEDLLGVPDREPPAGGSGPRPESAEALLDFLLGS
jgi:virulence factor Mce-like protein